MRIICLIAIILSAGIACGAEVEAGKPAPELHDARALGGAKVSIADYRGKVLLLDFWATWCGPCIFQLPDVFEIYNKYHGDGLEILGISLDTDIQKLENFVARYEIPWPQVCDGMGWDNRYADRYGVHGIPHTVLIDEKGIVRAVDPHGEELEELITALLDVSPRPFSPQSTVSWSPEVPPASGEVRITYRPFRPELKEADGVFMVWGVNFWQEPDASSWPKGSRAGSRGEVHTPMTREEDAWTVTIPLNGGVSEIDLYFRSLEKKPSAGRFRIETAAGRDHTERLSKGEEAAGEKNWDGVVNLLEPVVKAEGVSPQILAEAAAILAEAYLQLERREDIESLIAAVRKQGAFHPPWMNQYAWEAAVADEPARGRLLVAEALAALVAAEDPNPNILDTHAWVLYRLGEYDRAASQQEKGIEAGGDSADYYYRYAAILAAAGKLDQAREAYRTGRQLRQRSGMEGFRKEAEKRMETASG